MKMKGKNKEQMKTEKGNVHHIIHLFFHQRHSESGRERHRQTNIHTSY